MGADEHAIAENWALVNAPLGQDWSGRARYAAAMFFYKHGDMNAETLEVYRICARLDAEDPLAIIRDRGIGKEWLQRMDETGRQARGVTGADLSGK